MKTILILAAILMPWLAGAGISTGPMTGGGGSATNISITGVITAPTSSGALASTFSVAGSNYIAAIASSTTSGFVPSANQTNVLNFGVTNNLSTSGATGFTIYDDGGININSSSHTPQVDLGFTAGGINLINGQFNVNGNTITNAFITNSIFAGNGSGLTGITSNSVVSINPSQIYPTISSGGNVYSNLPTILTNTGNVFAGTYSGNGAGLTNLPNIAATAVFPITAAVNGTFISQSNLGGIYFSPTNSPSWELVQRQFVTTAAVPTLTAVSAGSCALDISPGLGVATDAGFGYVWEDLCATNCNTNSPGPLFTLHLAIHPAFTEVASVAYNSGTALPLEFTEGSGSGNVVVMSLCPNLNNYVGIGTTNPTANLDVTNVNGAATVHIAGLSSSTLSGVELSGENNSAGANFWYLNAGHTDDGFGLRPHTVVISNGTDATNGMNFINNLSGVNAGFRFYSGGSAANTLVMTVNSSGINVTTNTANTFALTNDPTPGAWNTGPASRFTVRVPVYFTLSATVAQQPAIVVSNADWTTAGTSKPQYSTYRGTYYEAVSGVTSVVTNEAANNMPTLSPNSLWALTNLVGGTLTVVPENGTQVTKH